MFTELTADTTGGAIVYWSLGAVNRPEFAIRMADVVRGSIIFPERRPISLLRDAMLEIAEESQPRKARLLVRPLLSGTSIVSETKGALANDYETMMSGWIDDGSIRVIPVELTAQVTQRYERIRDVMTAQQVGAVMVDVVNAVMGLTLREHGCLYWVPKQGIDEMKRAASAVQGCLLEGERASFSLIRHPMDADAVAAISDAISREIDTQTARIESELAAEGEDALGARAIATREEELARLRKKLACLSSSIGSLASTLAERLDATDVLVAAAAMRAAA